MVPSISRVRKERQCAVPETMRKGAAVAVRLYIEGEDEPAHDYAQLAAEIARQVMTLGIAAYQQKGQFRVHLTSLNVLEGSAGEEDEETVENAP